MTVAQILLAERCSDNSVFHSVSVKQVGTHSLCFGSSSSVTHRTSSSRQMFGIGGGTDFSFRGILQLS